MPKKNTDPVTLEISQQDLERLRKCLLVMQDAFTLNESIDDSCMAILLTLRKSEQKKLRGFVAGMVKQLGFVKLNSGDNSKDMSSDSIL